MADNVPGKISDGQNQEIKNENCDNDNSDSISCDPCHQDGDKKTAEGFCVECQHYLCEECFKYHCLPKPSRHHKLLIKSEMPRKTVDESLSEICSIHKGELIKYYCKTHKIVVCNSCIIIEHKQCDEICPLESIAKDVEDSILYQTFLTRTEEAMAGLDDQIKTCRENLTITKTFKETSLSDINVLQEKMNNQFESLKQNVAKEAEEQEKNDIRKIRNIEISVDDTKDAIQNLIEECEILKETKQNKQLFVALNVRKEKLKMLEQKLNDITKTNKIEKYSFVPNKIFSGVLEGIDEIGKLCIQTEKVLQPRNKVKKGKRFRSIKNIKDHVV